MICKTYHHHQMQNEKPGPYRSPLKITDYQHISSSRTFEITLDDGRCFTLVYTNNKDEVIGKRCLGRGFLNGFSLKSSQNEVFFSFSPCEIKKPKVRPFLSSFLLFSSLQFLKRQKI